MCEEYKNDRKWSDAVIYDKALPDFKNILTESEMLGHVNNIEPANQEDDNLYNIDTYINDIPIQVRLQRLSCKKSEKYCPTLRYERPGQPTEVHKMINMYNDYLKTGKHKMPKYLLWAMIDKKMSIAELKLINLRELFEDRWINLNKDPDYKMRDDSEKFIYKENNDRTSFLVVKTNKYTKYHFER